MVTCGILTIVSIWGLVFGLIQLPDLTYKETEKTGEYELVSIQDNSKVNGRGTFLYASIDTEEVYIFYYKDGDGYKQGKISAENAFYDLLSRGLFNASEKSHEIYVPKDTVVRDFTLDAQ